MEDLHLQHNQNHCNTETSNGNDENILCENQNVMSDTYMHQSQDTTSTGENKLSEHHLIKGNMSDDDTDFQNSLDDLKKISSEKGVEFNVSDFSLNNDDNADDISDYSHLSDEELALKLGASSKIIRAIRQNQINMEKLNENMKLSDLDRQIDSLSNKEFYNDISVYKDQLKQYAIEKNCDIKTAYNSMFAERRYEEIKKLTEKKCAENFSKKQSRYIEASTGGSSNSNFANIPNLTKEQLEVAKAYGMSASEYARYLNNQ